MKQWKLIQTYEINAESKQEAQAAFAVAQRAGKAEQLYLTSEFLKIEKTEKEEQESQIQKKPGWFKKHLVSQVFGIRAEPSK